MIGIIILGILGILILVGIIITGIILILISTISVIPIKSKIPNIISYSEVETFRYDDTGRKIWSKKWRYNPEVYLWRDKIAKWGGGKEGSCWNCRFHAKGRYILGKHDCYCTLFYDENGDDLYTHYVRNPEKCKYFIEGEK